MTRRQFLASSLAAPLLAQTGKRPNIILFMTDDQGYGDLGCHGNPVLKTPAIDGFAQTSVHMDGYYSNPVCSPTRASLLTGRYYYRTGVTDTYLGRSMMHADEVTLAEVLRQNGYRTGIFGKWHLGDCFPLRAMDQGFEEALCCTGGGLTQPSDPPGNHYTDPILYHNGQAQKYPGYCTDIFVDNAMAWIEKNSAAPFFCYIPTNAPHTPLEIADKWVEPYKGKGLDDITEKVYGMVANMDWNFGRLIAFLKQKQLAENTIVIFTTDNGPQQKRFNAGLRDLKGTVYEGGIKVPFYVRWPGKTPEGAKHTQLSAHIDVMPTLLEAAGVEKSKWPKKMDGRSMLAFWTSKKRETEDRTIVFQWHRGDKPVPFQAAAIRNQKYKLVNGRELYQLAVDPGEKKDLAAELPDMVQKLRQEYERWYKDVQGSRNFEPPRIFLGAPEQNPVTLTRQDWRGSNAGWTAKSNGEWLVDVRTAGKYKVTIQFEPATQPRMVQLKSGAAAPGEIVTPGTKELPVIVDWKPGLATLSATLSDGAGPTYLIVEKLPG